VICLDAPRGPTLQRMTSGDVLGVIVGTFMVVSGVLILWKRAAAARVTVRIYAWQAKQWPWLYPGPLRRWSTSEKLLRVLLVPVGVGWTYMGVWWVVEGLARR
jgi:hypothetical protein